MLCIFRDLDICLHFGFIYGAGLWSVGDWVVSDREAMGGWWWSVMGRYGLDEMEEIERERQIINRFICFSFIKSFYFLFYGFELFFICNKWCFWNFIKIWPTMY